MRPKIVLFLFALSLFVGCTSSLAIQPAVDSYKKSDFEKSYEQVLELEKSYLKQQGELIFSLDAGVLAHHSKRYRDSNVHLEKAELLIKELYTESISANLASFLVNDNTKAYQGEDYEDLYLNIFKALNYLNLNDYESSLVELRRLSEKQQLLKDKYTIYFEKMAKQKTDFNYLEPKSIRFSSSALGNYLYMIIARDINEPQEANFFAQQVKSSFATQKNLYNFPIPTSFERDLLTPSKDKVRLNIVAFSGLGPYKEEFVERFWFSPANYIKIALPRLISQNTKVTSIEVTLNTNETFKLEALEEMGLIAKETFLLKQAAIESKTILRSYLKATGTLAIDVATDVLASSSSDENERSTIQFWGSLISFASRVFNEASEQADVRSSHFFPDKAWLGGIDLKPGTYTAKIIYKDKNNSIIGFQQLNNLIVGPNRVNLFSSVCPY